MEREISFLSIKHRYNTCIPLALNVVD